MNVLLLAATVFLECESFTDLGGWTVETQSIRQEGSSYLMAHGYGVPVADAETTVRIPEDGTYVVWARTRNWNAPWTGGAAGRFQVVLRGTETPAWTSAELGTEGADWHWQRAGEAALKAGVCRVALHDRTGFNGRCDALFFASAGERPPARTPAGTVRDDPKEWGLVVVGGGFAGCCTALAAAREGVPTLLLQDREVLGGCNSSEVRVGLGGRIHVGPYPKLGEVVAEIQPLFGYGRPLDKRFYEDDRKDTAFLIPTLWRGVAGVAPARRYRQHVFAVEMDPVQTNRIAAVLARDTRSGTVTRVRARLFCDATGDAIVSRLAGCETMYGREARARFNEISAPVAADRRVMGMSVQWLTEWRKEKAPFPDISDWALPIDETTGYYQTSGSWEQESGFYHDMADETERIRDYALLAIFSNWHWLKNRSARRANYANVAFSWISPIGGKRESHRTVGAYVLNQNDLENHVAHPDGTAAITWDIDLHFPDPENERKFKEPFRSAAYHRGFGADYPVPYRCLYARDCANLFLAGRDISCSHVAFAAVRVQRTLGMLGEVVGLAAGICHRRALLPADVYAKGLDELKAALARGVTPLPQFHGYHNGMGEKYDFNRRGWAHVYPQGRTNNLPSALAADIRQLGFVHRNEHPALADRRRRLVLVDESRARLHYYDSADPSAGFAVPIRKPGWDLKAVGGTRYRTVCRGGFQVTDLAARKVVDTFDFPIFHSAEPTACCDLPDGGFVFAVNPVGPDKGKSIHFCVFSPDRTMTRIIRLRGFVNARSFAPGRDGEWLVAHEHGFARVRFPAEGRDVAAILVKDYPQPAGRNSFDVRPAAHGTGFWTTTGYGAELLRVAADGTVARRIRAEQGGKANFFYAQLTERADGNVYVANWTGHGAQDSYRGWQVVEFAPSGEVVWRLDSPERYGSISGVLEIEGGETVSPKDDLLLRLRQTAESPSYYWAWTYPWLDHGDCKGDRRHVVEKDGRFLPKPTDNVKLESVYQKFSGGRRAVISYADLASLVGTWHPDRYYRVNRAGMTAVVKRQWKEFGGVMVFNWHMDHPYCTNGYPQASYRFKSTGENRNVIRQILDGTGDPCGAETMFARNARPAFANPRDWFFASLKDVADFFNGLVDEDGRKIPVILRYPHECDGKWFWWGQTWCTTDEFRRFCRMEADYLRKACGEGQILFAYTPDKTWTDFGREGDAANTFMAYYPGDAYVDILGIDDYSIGNGDDAQVGKSLRQTVHKLRLLSAFATPRGKVVCISESGGDRKRDDFFLWLHRAATAEGVKVAFVNTWAGRYGSLPATAASEADEKAFAARPQVLMEDARNRLD